MKLSLGVKDQTEKSEVSRTNPAQIEFFYCFCDHALIYDAIYINCILRQYNINLKRCIKENAKCMKAPHINT